MATNSPEQATTTATSSTRPSRRNKRRHYKEMAGNEDPVEQDIVIPDEGYYNVDRVIRMRKQERECLVLWEGFGPEDATWVKTAEVTSDALRTYYHPTPTLQTVHHYVANFLLDMQRNLDYGALSDGTNRTHFRHDVYRFLFNDKQQLGLDDFDTDYFRPDWNQSLTRYIGKKQTKYTGCRVVFPIKATLYLEYTKQRHYCDIGGTVHVKPRRFIEKVRFKFIKEDITHTV